MRPPDTWKFSGADPGDLNDGGQHNHNFEIGNAHFCISELLWFLIRDVSHKRDLLFLFLGRGFRADPPTPTF